MIFFLKVQVGPIYRELTALIVHFFVFPSSPLLFLEFVNSLKKVPW